MANSYIIDNTAGTIHFTIEPGTLNGPGGVAGSNTDLYLYGQGALQWGEGILENIYRLSENYACPEKEATDAGYVVGSPRPKDGTDLGSINIGITKPLDGQSWYNTTSRITYTYDSGNNLISTQDETDFNGGVNNGTFTGGSGYDASDTITLSNGTIITVDAVGGSNNVTQFTITTSGTNPVTAGEALTQDSTSDTGIGFTLTPQSNNQAGDNWLRSNGLYVDYEPTSPITGVLKYESDFHAAGVDQLLIYDGTSFISVAQEYTRLAGDTMTGLLTLSADPTSPLHAATKQYTDNTFVDVSGDTMTGLLTLSADPTSPLHAATKQYTDNTFVDASGDTMSGDLDMGTNQITNVVDPTGDLVTGLQDVATKNYIINVVLGAVFDVGSYHFGPNPTGKLPGTWVQLPAGTFLMASGGGSGTTGGSNAKTLTAANMPAHSHSRGSMDISGVVAGGTGRGFSDNGGGNSGAFAAGTQRSAGVDGNGSADWDINFLASRSWIGRTSSEGSGTSFDITPQYEDVEVWKRIL